MKAVFWDYDGTLVDTRQKNYQVTRNIIEDVTNGEADRFPILQSFENYKAGIKIITNWRDIYQEQLGFSETETDRIGKLWTEYQIRDTTETPLFTGIEKVVRDFNHLPQAIISQNSSTNIRGVLQVNRLNQFFCDVIGFEEVDMRRQKPDPAGTLLCIERMKLNNHSIIYYIGDHESDVQLVNNSNKDLLRSGSKISLKSVAVFYGNDQEPDSWQTKPDFTALSRKIFH